MTDGFSYSMFGMGPAAQAASDDPEAFQLLQNERNRQILANMLLARGGAQPQGQMAGRFYVPPSPLQHVGNLAQMGMGAYLMGKSGEGFAGLAERRNEARKQAIQKYVADTQGEQVPERTLPEGIEGPTNAAMTIPPDPAKSRAAVLEALSNNDPRVRDTVRFMEQQRQQTEQNALSRDSREEMTRLLLSQKGDALKAQLDGLNLQLQDKMLAREDRARLEQERQQKDQEFKRWQTEFEAKSRREAVVNKPPAGYRFVPDGNLEAIPGGPADTKLQGAYNQDTAQLQSSTSNFDRLASTANAILNHPGLAGITGIRGKVPDIPGTAAADARALLATLKSQVAFDVLQDMRNNSKTGGALGNVSDAEGKRLENNLAALDTSQGIDQFKKQVGQIIEFANSAKGRLQDAYNLKHKGASAPSGGGGLTPAEQQELDQLRKRFGK